MKILLLTLCRMEDIGDQNIHPVHGDLVRELADSHEVTVVTPREKRFGLPTECVVKNNVTILKVRVGNITQTKSLIEKGIATLTIEHYFMCAANKYLKNSSFDLVIYSTPPITFNRIIKKYKSTGTITLLALKDIFPQNAVDLKLMSSSGIVYNYFRRQERKLYALSDYIGCMSPANVAYVATHNQNVADKLFVLPNAICPKPKYHIESEERIAIRMKYGFAADKLLFIYGGNIGKPQDIDYISGCVRAFEQFAHDAHLVIVGSGTAYENVVDMHRTCGLQASSMLSLMPKTQFDELLKACDVGLVFLDHRFTIPNHPSRILSYLEYALPILAATDCVTDIKDLVNTYRIGKWCCSDKVENFVDAVAWFISNQAEIAAMRERSRDLLTNKFKVSDVVKLIINKISRQSC